MSCLHELFNLYIGILFESLCNYFYPNIKKTDIYHNIHITAWILNYRNKQKLDQTLKALTALELLYTSVHIVHTSLQEINYLILFPFENILMGDVAKVIP